MRLCGHGMNYTMLLQSGTTALYTIDNHGDERQLGLLVRQWAHHGPLAGSPHPSILHAAGIAMPTSHTQLLPVRRSQDMGKR